MNAHWCQGFVRAHESLTLDLWRWIYTCTLWYFSRLFLQCMKTFNWNLNMPLPFDYDYVLHIVNFAILYSYGPCLSSVTPDLFWTELYPFMKLKESVFAFFPHWMKTFNWNLICDFVWDSYRSIFFTWPSVDWIILPIYIASKTLRMLVNFLWWLNPLH
jgi:hypothetical protein